MGGDRLQPTTVLIGHITPENDWAVDVGLAARLELDQGGYLALRAHEAARSRTSPTAPCM